MISHLSEGEAPRALIRYIGENEEYCTSTSNLKKIESVNNAELYKLKVPTRSLNTPYSNTTGDEISSSTILSITHECGIYSHVKNNDTQQDLGWFETSGLKKFIDINNMSVAEFKSKFQVATSAAVIDIKQDWKTEEAACNLCVRAALRNLTGDDVLFPTIGSSVTIRTWNEAVYGEVSNGGSAQAMVDDLMNGNLNDYFEEVIKSETETYDQFWARLQNMVDNSKAIIVGAFNPRHVFMIVPGGQWQVVNNSSREEDGTNETETNIHLGDKWGGSFAIRNFNHVLRIMDCGSGVKFSNGPLYGVMEAKSCIGEREGKILKFYKYIGN